MKNVIVSAAHTAMGTISTTADINDASKLGLGVISLLSSNGKVIAVDANTKAENANQMIYFVQGKGAGNSTKLGLKLNPFKLAYSVTTAVAAVQKVVALGYNGASGMTTANIVTAAQLAIATNVGKLAGVRVVLMGMPKTPYTQGVPFEQVDTQIVAGDTMLTVQTRLKAKLDKLALKIGNGFAVTSTNSSTNYYGFSFTADAGFNFTVIGSGLAELAKVATVTAVGFPKGAGKDILEAEKTAATRDGYNASFHSNAELYVEPFDAVAGTSYDVIIINSAAAPQYELFQDHGGMLVEQWIAVPTGGHATTGVVALITAILDKIIADNRGRVEVTVTGA